MGHPSRTIDRGWEMKSVGSHAHTKSARLLETRGHNLSQLSFDLGVGRFSAAGPGGPLAVARNPQRR
jgi:hypothetical protein